MRKLYLTCGILAPIAYVVTVIYGAAITPGYSHVAHAISSLVEAGAPLRWKIDPGFILYNCLLLAFAAGLLREVTAARRPGTLVGAALALTVVPILSLLMYFFPQDPIGSAPTTAGTVHLILALGTAVLTILTMLLTGAGARRYLPLQHLRRFAVWNALFVFITGGMSTAGMALKSPYFGIFERMTIGGFELWVLVLALSLLTGYAPAAYHEVKS
ncbi:MAG: hypothetical protein K0R39_799 [Symbiobacteriaceae bacterium]|jgi:hypothetical membrane protein|nr:hypothetical protein [Symbiobacteriaceae bacterium]